ncbi:PREDICTED: transcription factor bHLH143 [Ipomoea nil]|uniref:transcription factor bHLH143 n=1 Tax=Ipomoea nil TaxID=35883 RepID=UPI000901E67B|nr:PREDICTED: transcription factor bHLH143 [Ipomoea nil]
MVTGNELQPCQQYPAWNSPNLSHVSALLQLRQQVNLPSFPNSSAFTAHALSPGISTLLNGSPNLKASQASEINGVFLPMLPDLNILSPPATNDQYPSESQPAGRRVLPIDTSVPSRKKFLIFDQSGDQTRLFIGPSFSPQNELLPKKIVGNYGSQCKNLGTLSGHSFPMKPIIEEPVNRTHGSCKGSEMHEDSEEINALLYSDGDEDEEHDDDDVDGEDDEVTSTGHSPFMVTESISDHQQVRQLSENIASSDGSSKRQRLHDGGYKKSLFTHTATSAKIPKSCTNVDDGESSCVKESKSHMCSREKKIRIRETLRVLQSLILDINSNNDPLLVIDEAINYLKFMKMKVKEMGVQLPQAHTPFPQ